MTHRSRLCYITVDTNDLTTVAAFWSAALGIPREEVPEVSRGIYARLETNSGATTLLFQSVPEPKRGKNRIHLDIETDDVEAEVTRLETLGASRLRHVEERGYSFWVMQDPCGNEFCVIQPEYPELLREEGQLWEGR